LVLPEDEGGLVRMVADRDLLDPLAGNTPSFLRRDIAGRHLHDVR